MAERMLVIKQTKSGIGAQGKQRATLRALGLKHHQDQVTQPDNRAVRGMLHKVRHLVKVTTVAEEDS
ncbi:MAG: 50S ribosomal protein L30 [Gemmatimonadetes bacterium]|nr:50S ribosomal protein L30 [Gemmatimonadota bacterium]